MYQLARKILFLLPPELAHLLSLHVLDLINLSGLLRVIAGKRVNNPVRVMGIDFPNPVGLAAGLDKNAEHINTLHNCGFGFIEVGTVTPVAQPGNPRPRLFRLEKELAIINRMGFNNRGVEYLIKQVKRSRHKCVLGINIGKNKNTPLESAVDDYLAAYKIVYHYADYVTVNISSPNTPGLRELQHGEELEKLLRTLKDEQKKQVANGENYVPLVVKIAPDLSEQEIQDLANTFIKVKIDGVIATNTTNARPGLENTPVASESGGLSGLPLLNMSDLVVKQLSKNLRGEIPVIAVGGIMSLEDAQHKIDLGASLVQIYTGFIYHGPALVSECAKHLNT